VVEPAGVVGGPEQGEVVRRRAGRREEGLRREEDDGVSPLPESREGRQGAPAAGDVVEEAGEGEGLGDRLYLGEGRRRLDDKDVGAGLAVRPGPDEGVV